MKMGNVSNTREGGNHFENESGLGGGSINFYGGNMGTSS